MINTSGGDHQIPPALFRTVKRRVRPVQQIRQRFITILKITCTDADGIRDFLSVIEFDRAAGKPDAQRRAPLQSSSPEV